MVALQRAVSFCTGDSTEAIGTAGTISMQSTTVKNGTYALQISNPSSGETYWYAKAGFNSSLAPATISEVYWAVEFWYRPTDATPGTEHSIFSLDDASSIIHWRLKHETDGDLRITDDTAGTIQTITTPFSDNTWIHIGVECFLANSTGTLELFLDGVSQGNNTGLNILQGSSSVGSFSLYGPESSSDGSVFFDGVVLRSDASARPSILATSTQHTEVHEYQSGNGTGTADTGLTSNDSALSSGTWGATGHQPLSTSNTAVYSSGTLDGAVNFDDTNANGAGPGPNGDSNIDGTLHGTTYLWYGNRGNGSGTVHNAWYGNSGDGCTQSGDLGLTGTNTLYGTTSDSATVSPGTTEYVAMGMGKNGGGRDFNLHEMYGQVVHLPAAPGGGTDEEVGLIGDGKLTNSLLLKHLVR